jgi:sortase A
VDGKVIRRALRVLGGVLAVGGVALLAWVLVVWRWQDPFTALYTKIQQDRLERQYDERLAGYEAPRVAPASVAAVRRTIALEARTYRRATHRGEAMGRIVVPRLHLNMVFVDGTDDGSLEKGPGRDPRSYAPGEGRLIYIAGHRTTFLAPFAHIERLKRGDRVTLQMPYGTFVYRISGHRIVTANALSVLRSPRWEVLALQACHPRFLATHRYIAYAQPIAVRPRDGTAYSATATARSRLEPAAG